MLVNNHKNQSHLHEMCGVDDSFKFNNIIFEGENSYKAAYILI